MYKGQTKLKSFCEALFQQGLSVICNLILLFLATSVFLVPIGDSISLFLIGFCLGISAKYLGRRLCNKLLR